MKFRSCSTRCARKGLTLIEIVAASLLLGTMLTGALLAFTAHREQLRRATRKRQAVVALEQLLADWFTQPKWEELPRFGACPDNPELVWVRTEFQPKQLGEQWPVKGIRVELYERGERARPLTSIELLDAEPPPVREDAAQPGRGGS